MGSELFDILKDFGLTDYESRVMESLLLNDSLTPGEIVSISGIPQPRVYDVLGKLKDKKKDVRNLLYKRLIRT